MWKTIVDISVRMLDIVTTFANIVSDFFNKDIVDILNNIDIPIITDILNWITETLLNAFNIESITMFDFLFVNGVTVWLIINFVKFIKQIITN